MTSTANNDIEQDTPTGGDPGDGNPKAAKLYNNLISDGYTAKNLGSIDEFTKALADPEKANKIYTNLISDGYTEKNLGTQKYFMTTFAQPDISKAPVFNNPAIDNTLKQFTNQPTDAITQLQQANELAKKTKLENSGDGGMAMGTSSAVEVPDPDAQKQSQQIKDNLKTQGFDPDKLNKIFGDIPEDWFKNIPGFDKKTLLKNYQDNPNATERLVASKKWQIPLLSHIPEVTKYEGSAEADAMKKAILESGGDINYNDKRTDNANLVRMVNSYVKDPVEKENILKNLAIDRSFTYGQVAATPSITQNDPLSSSLNPTQLAAWNYIQDLSPEKAGGFEPAFLDPKLTKDNPGAELGRQETLKRLDEVGISLKTNYAVEKLTPIQKAYQNLLDIKSQRPLTADEYAQAKNLEAQGAPLYGIIKSSADQEANIGKTYPEVAKLNADNFAQELLGQKRGFIGNNFHTFGNAVAGTLDGIQNMLNYPLDTEMQHRLRQAEALGNSELNENEAYTDQSNQQLNTFTSTVSTALQKDINLIKNNNSLSYADKENEVNKLLLARPDEWSRTPTNKLNINFGSVAYGVGHAIDNLLPMYLLQGELQGGEGASALRKFGSMFAANAATSFQNEFADAVKNGEANPFTNAIRRTGIKSTLIAPLDLPDQLNQLAKLEKTTVGRVLKNFTTEELTKRFQVSSDVIEGFKKMYDVGEEVAKKFTEGSKVAAKVGLATTGGQLLNDIIDNKMELPEDYAKQFATSFLNFSIMGGLIGSAGLAFNKNPHIAHSLLDASNNPELYLKAKDDLLKNGAISKSEADQIEQNINLATEVRSKVPFVDDNGKPLSEEDQGKLMFAKMQQYKTEQDAKMDNPPKVQEAHEQKLADIESQIADITKPKPEDETQVAVAPYYDTKIADISDADELRNSDAYKGQLKMLNDVADKMGLEVKSIDPTIGGFKNAEGNEITEISNRVHLNTDDLDKAELYAAVVGAMSHQTQEATIAAKYIPHGSENQTAIEQQIKVSDLGGAIKALKQAGITDYEANQADNTIKILDFSNGDDAELDKKINNFANNLDKSNITYEAEHRAIESRYVDPERRSQLLEKAKLETNERQSGPDLRDLYQEASTRSADFQRSKESPTNAEPSVNLTPEQNEKAANLSQVSAKEIVDTNGLTLDNIDDHKDLFDNEDEYHTVKQYLNDTRSSYSEPAASEHESAGDGSDSKTSGAGEQMEGTETKDSEGTENKTGESSEATSSDASHDENEVDSYKAGLTVPVVNKFFEHDINPLLSKIGGTFKDAITSVIHTIDPKAGVSEKAISHLSNLLGDRNMAMAHVDKTLSGLEKVFDKMKDADRIDFINRMKTGQKQVTPQLQIIADAIRGLDNDLYKQIKELNPSAAWKENHYRVLWKTIPGTENNKFWSLNSKRPLQGDKGFLKQATLADMSEGIAKGGVPYSTNPIRMFKLAYADGMKYITARRMFNALKDDNMVQFVKTGQRSPDFFVPINDNISKVWFSTDKGLVKSGEYYIEQGAGRLLNNHLSRDLIREHAVGRGLMEIKNLYTTAELGLSGFHAVAEGLEAASSSIGVGIRKLVNLGLRGDFRSARSGILDILKAPFAPATTFIDGKAAIKFTTEKDFENSEAGKRWLAKTPDAKQYITDFFHGGGLMKQSDDLRAKTFTALKEQMGKDNYIGAAIRALPALNETVLSPLFNTYIPALKVGMFMKEFPLLLQENKGRLEKGTVTRNQLARKQVAFIEDRLGEMNFDNLFWNRTFKTAAQLMFRSVTWKLGNLRAMLGAPVEQAKEFMDAYRENRAPNLMPKMAWLFGLSAMQVTLAAVTQHLLAHKDLTSLKDVVAPQIDSNDETQRVIMPTYYKDMMHLWHDKGGYITTSMSGPFSKLHDIYTNKDFYNYEIYDPHSSATEKTEDIAKYMVPKPFSISSAVQQYQEHQPLGKVAMSFFGLNKAPGYLTHSDIENKIFDLYNLRNANPRPKSEKEANDGKKEIRELYKDKKVKEAEDKANELIKNGTLRPTQIKYLFSHVGNAESPTVYFFSKLPFEDRVYLYNEMNADEKKLYDPKQILKPYTKK